MSLLIWLLTSQYSHFFFLFLFYNLEVIAPLLSIIIVVSRYSGSPGVSSVANGCGGAAVVELTVMIVLKLHCVYLIFLIQYFYRLVAPILIVL